MPKKKIDAIGAALRLISYRERSTAELVTRLADKGYDSAEIDAAVERLRTLGYLDDERFARSLTESRVRNKHWGRTRILADLAKKGVPSDIAQSVLAELDAETETRTATEALGRWMRTNRAPSPLERRDFERAYRHLAARGFSSAIIMRVLGPARADRE